MKKRPKDTLVTVLLMAFCAAYFAATFHIRTMNVKTISDGFMPRLSAVMLFILLGVVLLQNFFHYIKNPPQPLSEEAVKKLRQKRKMLALVIGIFLVAILLFFTLGFVIAMAFFLFTLFYTLAPKGDRNLKLLIPLAIFAPVVIHLVFLHVFYVLLPPGILTFLA